MTTLPLYNQADDASPSEQVRRLKTHVGSAQGLLFVTPEFRVNLMDRKGTTFQAGVTGLVNAYSTSSMGGRLAL